MDYNKHIGRNILRLIWMAALTGPAFAQQAPDPADDTTESPGETTGRAVAEAEVFELEEFVVEGFRASMARSLELKREAARSEDFISATDISKFPDQNVAESLQRVAGVQLQRDNGEGRYISIRGLGPEFNVVTMNGRLLASDSAGREFSFDTLPSELIRSAAVIKSPSADMLEGSIGGTVDVRTARPFELPDFLVAGSVVGSLETERGDWAPRFSGLLSWTNPDDTFGVLVTANYSQRKFQLDRVDINGYFRASDHGYVDEGWPNVLGAAAPGLTGNATLNDAWVPQAVDFFRIDDTRTRETYTLTAQMKPTDNVDITVDLLYSAYDTTYDQHGFASFVRDFGISNAVVDDFGLNIDGNSDGDLADSVDQVGARVTQFTKADGTTDIIRAAFPRNTETILGGLNIRSDLTDTLVGSLDISYSQAENKGVNRNYFYVTGAPLITWYNGYNLGVVYDQGTGPVPSFQTAPEAMDPAYQRSHYIQRDGQDTKDEVLDMALDFEKTLGSGWISSVDFGARYTTRDKTVIGSFSADNFVGSVAGREVFGAGVNYDKTGVFTGMKTGVLSTVSGDFIRTIPVVDPDAYIAALDKVVPGLASGLQAVPVAARSGVVDEEVSSLYAKLNFDNHHKGGLPISGNIGLRYVSTDQTATGEGGNLIALKPSATAQDTEFVFDNTGTVSFTSSYDQLLPSLNLQVGIRPDLVMRFDASKVMTRPTLSNLLPSITSQDQGYQRESISRGNPGLAQFKAVQYGTSLEWYFDDHGAVYCSVFFKDMENRVFNAQVRRTFPDANGTNPAVYASGSRAGQPIEVLVSQPYNTGDEEILGAEIGIEKTFDELPGFLSGFGVQLNYTYIDSKASYDNGLVSRVFGPDSEGAANFLRNPPKSGQGLSENSFNIVAFYEQGPFSARLAYNWRDQYLISPIAGPNGWPLYEEGRGQLDLSVSYRLREGVTLFLDATNVLQDEFRRFYDNSSTVASDNFFESMNYYGRTVAVGLRASF